MYCINPFKMPKLLVAQWIKLVKRNEERRERSNEKVRWAMGKRRKIHFKALHPLADVQISTCTL